MKKYETIDHTADLGIVVYGRDLKELFQNAGEALFEVLCDLSRVEGICEKQVILYADDLEQLMVVWLGELLYLHDTESLLFKHFEVKGIDEKRLFAVVYGEPLKVGHHTVKTGMKAVTYHQIEVRQEQGRWVSRVIFDI